MWLINTTTLRLELHLDSNLPQYVILSHTWGTNEISFQQIQSGRINGKIMSCCTRARTDGFQYVWVDTCCIDKSSSSELSEVINSMFKWYKDSAICYVYLEDGADIIDDGDYEQYFRACRWFTRGWTLQELIGPLIIEFYSQNWIEIGTKLSLKTSISAVTGIPVDVLSRKKALAQYNVAERMSWAASRRTTRLEDEAYCLMGIFDVNMPLLYGEGRRAFSRLQEEIFKAEQDYTIFAWHGDRYKADNSLLASSPSDFHQNDPSVIYSYTYPNLKSIFNYLGRVKKDNHVFLEDSTSTQFHVTLKGVRLTLPVLTDITDRAQDTYFPICISGDSNENDPDLTVICLSLQLNKTTLHNLGSFFRVVPGPFPKTFSLKQLTQIKRQHFFIPQNSLFPNHTQNSEPFLLSFEPFPMLNSISKSFTICNNDRSNTPCNAVVVTGQTIYEIIDSGVIKLKTDLCFADREEDTIIFVYFGATDRIPWCIALEHDKYNPEKTDMQISKEPINGTDRYKLKIPFGGGSKEACLTISMKRIPDFTEYSSPEFTLYSPVFKLSLSLSMP